MFKSALEQLGVEPEQVSCEDKYSSISKYMPCRCKTAECVFFLSLSGFVAGRR